MDKIIHHRKYSLVIVIMLFLHLRGHTQKISFVSKAVNRVAEGSTYQYAVRAFDSLGRTIEYTVANLPSWIKFNKEKNTLSGLAKKAGQYPIQINAVTKDTTVTQHFMLTVYNKQTVNILPIGNSITNGTSVYNSYRRSLWQLLHAANYNFDFIGSWDKHHMSGEVPNPDFDMDHDGHSGWKASDVLQPPDWDMQRGNLREWLKNYTPNIVLIELGTNEVFQCVPVKEAIANIDTIIQLLRKKNPVVKILLAQIPPLGNQWGPKKLCGTDTAYDQAIKIFNEGVVGFARKKNTKQSPVILVDQFTGVDPSVDMYDDIHPNDKGEKIMAERWFAPMKKYLKKIE
jgi:acyl-CoA thioesterase-1